MKKILSLVLVLVLALGSFSFATPADVVGTDYATAVDRLMSLNLLTGYPDGTFKPAATITRAEFAAVVVRALGLGSAASVNSPTKFSDVPATHWASGYVSVATGLGVINGHTDGTFRPADPVTYEQAVAMVVRALGYEPSVAKKGGYPAGYLIVASELDILDGVVGTVGAPAPRGLVAMLVDNSLQVDMMKQTQFGDEVIYKAMPGETLLKGLGLTEDTKTVASVNTDDNTIKFDGDTNTYKAAAGLKFDTNLNNLKLSVWTKSKTVYVYTIESTVMFDYVVSDVAQKKSVKLSNADKVYALNTLANGNVSATVDVDGGAEASIDDDGIPANSYTGFYGKFILNDDNQVTHMTLTTTIPFVGALTSVTDTTLKLTNVLSDQGNTATLVDMDDADFGFVVIDGKLAKYADLKEGMFVQYGLNGGYYFIVASTSKIEGKLDSVRNDLGKVTIAGTTYSLNGISTRISPDKMDNFTSLAVASDLNDYQGTVVTAYKNAKGKVAVIVGDIEETTTSFYGFIRNADTFGEKVKITQVVDGKIKTVTYSYDLGTADKAIVAGYQNADDYEGTISGIDQKDLFEFTVDKDNVLTDITAVAGVTDVIVGDVPSEVALNRATKTALTVDASVVKFVKSDLVIFDLSEFGKIKLFTLNELVASDFVSGTPQVIVPTTAKPGVILVTVSTGLDTTDTDKLYAFAKTAPTLTNEKYTATVITKTGNLEIVVDDGDAEIWTKANTMLVIQKKANGEYDVLSKDESADTDGFMDALAYANALVATTGTPVDAAEYEAGVLTVDGQYITIGADTYKIADDAIVLRQYADDDFSVSNYSAMVSNDDVSFIHTGKVIDFIIYRR
jgi:hypothetical protein